MKNITTFNLKLIGFFLLITALISCEKEYNEIIDEETSNEQLTDPYSVHSFDELNISGNADFSNALAHYGQITDKVAKADVTSKNTKDKELYNFTLDSSTVNQVNLEKYSSFTFKVNRPYPTPTYTENLVIDKYSTGNIRAFLIKYIPSEETKMIEEHNTVHFVGERVVQRLDPDMLGLSARDWCVPVVELWCRWGSEDHIAGPRCIEEAKSSNSVGTRLFLNNTEHCTEIADDDFTTGGGSSPDPGSGGTSGGGGIGGDPDMGTVGTFPNGITTLDSDDDLPLITQWETVVINPLPENPTEKELEEKNKALIAYLYTLNGSVHSEFISILTSNLNDPSLNLADKVWLWERNKKMFELVSFYSYDTDITFDDFYNRLSFSDKKILDKNAAETALLSSVKSVVGQYWPKNADEWAGLFKIMSPLLVDVGIEFLPGGGIVNACRDTFAGLTTGDYTTAVIGVVGVVMEFVPWAKLAKIAAKVYDIGKSAFKIFKVAYTFLADIAATLGKGFKTILDGDNLKLFDKFDNLVASGDDVGKVAANVADAVNDVQRNVLNQWKNTIGNASNARKGNFGEMGTDLDLADKGYIPLHTRIDDIDAPGHNGIDAVMEKDGQYFIVESKYSSTTTPSLNSATSTLPKQMSDAWIQRPGELANAVGGDVVLAQQILTSNYTRILATHGPNGNKIYKLVDSLGNIGDVWTTLK